MHVGVVPQLSIVLAANKPEFFFHHDKSTRTSLAYCGVIGGGGGGTLAWSFRGVIMVPVAHAQIEVIIGYCR